MWFQVVFVAFFVPLYVYVCVGGGVREGVLIVVSLVSSVVSDT